MRPAVILFVYNRLEHVIKSISSLNRCKDAELFDLYIFSDGAKNIDDVTNVKKVRSYLHEISKDLKFGSVTFYEAESNKGLANSVIKGVTQIITRYGKVIVVEDDLIVSGDFLTYMDQALDFYEQNMNIWSVSGYTPDFMGRENIPSDVYFHYRGCSWGWGTWKNRWDTVDWNVLDYGSFVFDIKKRRNFNRGSRDLSEMLDRYMRHEIDSWAIRWCYSESKQDRLTVYPKFNKVYNSGMDGTGTHSECKDQDVFANGLEERNTYNFLIDANVDDEIVREFNRKYEKKMNVLSLCRHTANSILKRFFYLMKKDSVEKKGN